MNSPKFNQSIYPNKCLFYEDVKQFAKVYFVKVYFVNAVAVRIRQSFSSPKFPVLQILAKYVTYIVFFKTYTDTTTVYEIYNIYWLS